MADQVRSGLNHSSVALTDRLAKSKAELSSNGLPEEIYSLFGTVTAGMDSLTEEEAQTAIACIAAASGQDCSRSELRSLERAAR